MNNNLVAEDSFRITQRKHLIRRVLMTPKQIEEKKLKDQKDSEWTSQAYSEDPVILGKLIKREWKKFEPLVENSTDKRRIKRMFSIK